MSSPDQIREHRHEGRLTEPPSSVVAVATALPSRSYPQAEITDVFARVVGVDEPQRRMLDRLHANAGVASRHLALPLERYADLGGFTAANTEFVRVAVELAESALLGALDQAGARPADVDVVITATVTGLAVPSLDSRLVTRCGLRGDVKRMPLVGLGCVAGAAGLARAHDYLTGHPGALVALVCVELCSLTVQSDDRSVANLVAAGLFGDGAACVLLAGAEHPLAAAGRGATAGGFAARAGRRAGAPGAVVAVRATRSRFYDDTERAMGFDVGGHGLRIVLDVQVPDLVRTHIRADVDDFLADHGIARDEMAFWVAHPGGPKVLEALAAALDTPSGALELTWRSLERIGNISSVSVLHVLRDTLEQRPPPPGSLGLLLAMGPGFCSELVLLESR